MLKFKVLGASLLDWISRLIAFVVITTVTFALLYLIRCRSNPCGVCGLCLEMPSITPLWLQSFTPIKGHGSSLGVGETSAFLVAPEVGSEQIVATSLVGGVPSAQQTVPGVVRWITTATLPNQVLRTATMVAEKDNGTVCVRQLNPVLFQWEEACTCGTEVSATALAIVQTGVLITLVNGTLWTGNFTGADPCFAMTRSNLTDVLTASLLTRNVLAVVHQNGELAIATLALSNRELFAIPCQTPVAAATTGFGQVAVLCNDTDDRSLTLTTTEETFDVSTRTPWDGTEPILCMLYTLESSPAVWVSTASAMWNYDILYATWRALPAVTREPSLMACAAVGNAVLRIGGSVAVNELYGVQVDYRANGLDIPTSDL